MFLIYCFCTLKCMNFFMMLTNDLEILSLFMMVTNTNNDCFTKLFRQMEIQKSSMQPPKRSRRRSTPSTRRTWTPTEESTLINGLKELCVNGRRADNGTFRPGYLMELEHYLRERHPESGLKGEPHVNSKLKFWKRSYASLSLLKGRSGLGFQYSDGTIIIDDPKECDKFLKVINILLLEYYYFI
ncbi:hypothetical protein RDI58_023182 [Solanum bulbocastanum]|uniref:Myb/SANT-like domain-containing protein n=1 Tax=Solanum bulbocastanum TaxID=147425 RepID=A0AAN8TAL9_SOLBU